mmetsp:Transcript_31553/g.57132  ORF Transcript_31553/g.57132 Transcript_31553/m.57132 type:complete len:390 (+) Transcript_31553:112-1281(+)
MAFDYLFSKNEQEERYPDAFWRGLLVSSVAVIVTIFLYFIRLAVRVSKRRKARRRKSLRKSVQMRPRRRQKRPDSEFRHAFRRKSPDEISSQLLKLEEESVTSQESQYEEYEDYDLDEASLKEMKNALPKSTTGERRRFLIDKDGETNEAIEALESYLEWRQKHAEIETELERKGEEAPQDDKLKASGGGDSDFALWNKAAAVALHSANDESTHQTLPRIVQMFHSNGKECTDNDGHVIFKLSPAQIDDNLVKDVKTCSLALALYLDRKLDRHDAHQTVTLLIDVRGGKGWPNPSPKTLIPFLVQTVHLLLEMLPQRLHRAIVYPIPNGFLWIWSIVERGLDAETADRCHLLSGSARIASKAPKEELSEYMSLDLVDFMEEERLASFAD